MRRKALSLLALVLIAALGVMLGLGNSRAGMRATAAASLYLSPTGSDANSCTQAAPCATFNRAYQRAQLGDTVEVAGGTYGSQVVSPRNDLRGQNGCDPYGEWGTATTAKCVTFVPASGATVMMTGPLEVHGSSLWFDGTRNGPVDADKSAYNWTVRGYVDVEVDSGGSLQDHVTFNGIWANAILSSDSDKTMFRQMAVGNQVASATGGSCMWLSLDDGQPVNSFESKFPQRNVAAPTNVVLDQDYFHDTDRDAAGAAASCHFGGMIIVNVDGMTIRRSVFSQMWVYPIEIKLDTGSTFPTNITIENNWFGCAVEGSYLVGNRTTCSGQDAIQIDGAGTPITNYLIRYNSFSQSGSVGCYNANCQWSNVRLVGNAGQVPSGGADGPCGASGVTDTYNAWYGGTCGSTDTSVAGYSSLYVSNTAGAENYHLIAGSPAINFVPTSAGCPALDIDGQARPIGSACDAGADESGTPLPPPPTTTATTTTATTTTTTTASTTTATTTAPSPRLAEFKQFVADAQAASYYSKWSAQNPGELSRWSTFRDALLAGSSTTVPAMSTKYGASLVDAGILYLG